MSIDVWEIVPSVALVPELYSTNVQYNIIDSYPFHINHMHRKIQFSTLPPKLGPICSPVKCWGEDVREISLVPTCTIDTKMNLSDISTYTKLHPNENFEGMA